MIRSLEHSTLYISPPDPGRRKLRPVPRSEEVNYKNNTGHLWQYYQHQPTSFCHRFSHFLLKNFICYSDNMSTSRFNSSCATSSAFDVKESLEPVLGLIEKRQQLIRAKTKNSIKQPTSKVDIGDFEAEVTSKLSQKLDTIIANEDSIKIAFCEAEAGLGQVPSDRSILLNVGQHKQAACRVLSSLQKKPIQLQDNLMDTFYSVLNQSKPVELSSIRKVAESRKLMQEVKGKVKGEFIGGQPN